MEFENIFLQSSQIGDKLQSFFDKSIVEDLAKSTKFVQRISPMTGEKFSNLCIGGMSESGMGASLNQLCAMALDMGVKLCEQSLNERFNSKAVAFMKKLFEKAIALRFEQSELEVMKEFSQIMLEDSTVIQLPENLSDSYKGCGGGASKAALKIDFTYDFKTAEMSVENRPGSQPDIGMQLPKYIVPNSLWLRDMGYFKSDDFKRINKEGAFYVSRFKYGNNLYLTTDKKAKPLDLLDILRKMKTNEVKDLEVFMGFKKRLPVRLILQKVPKKVADEKRHKLRKDKQKKCKNTSKGRLEFCNANAFITNLKGSKWPPHLIMALYKIRWQIEILFKVWKSILKVGNVHKMNPERFKCLLYGQLIWAIINMKIFQVFKAHFWNNCKIEISELKVYNIMKPYHQYLIKAIYQNCKILYEQCLFKMFEAVELLGKKQYKRGNPNPVFSLVFP